MNDGSQLTATTIRGEIKALFGLRWDTAVEWTMICWLSAWVLTAPLAGKGAGADVRDTGPISWIARSLWGLGLDAPEWIGALSLWLRDPGRPWLEVALIFASAILLTAAVRSVSLAGLRTVGLLSLAGVFEISRTYSSASVVLLIALMPALTAIVIGVVSDRTRRDREERRTEFYLPQIIVRTFLTQVMLVILAPLIAPLLLLGMLVVGYKSSLPYRPITELAFEARKRMEQSSVPLEKLDALTASAALVSAILAGNSSREAHEVAAGFHLSLRDRRQADDMRRRDEVRQRMTWATASSPTS